MKVEKVINWLKRFCGKNTMSEISHQKKLDNLTKMDVCDFCFEEANQGNRKEKNINRYNWTFDMLHKSLRLCNEHMNILLEGLEQLKEEGKI